MEEYEDDFVAELVEEASFDHVMGNAKEALEKLARALEADPQSSSAWHARAEILLSLGRLDEALEAGEKALRLGPDAVHLHTTLSRIQVARGDKEKAEEHGARARTLGWKEELKEPPPAGDSMA